MITADRYADLVDSVGQELGTSDWITIDQDLIDRFADLTGDHIWVHSDPERAVRDLAGGQSAISRAGGPLPTACSPSP